LLLERVCDAYSLALAACDTYAAFADKGLVLLGPAFDGVGDLGLLRSRQMQYCIVAFHCLFHHMRVANISSEYFELTFKV
jgi:hypothetical protein